MLARLLLLLEAPENLSLSLGVAGCGSLTHQALTHSIKQLGWSRPSRHLRVHLVDLQGRFDAQATTSA